MSIKNWTVTTERVKSKDAGLAEYVSYLESARHKNHKNTTIYALFNSDGNSFIDRTIQETLLFDSRNKKGGRKVESFAQSYNFILPPPHKPNCEQWANIAYDLLREAHSELNIKSDLNRFVRACFANVHDQTNPHINIVIPRIYEGERLADLDRKNLLAKLKQEFNRSVLKNCNIDHTHYKPLRVNVGRRKTAQRYEYENASSTIEEANSAMSSAALARKQNEIAMKELENKEIALNNEKAIMMIERARLGFFIKAFKDFKSSLTRWVDSIRRDSTLDILVNRQELEQSANKITESDKVDDESSELVESMIDEQTKNLEKENFEILKPEFSRRRRKRPKAS